MKRLLWITIAMLLLQPVFSSLKIEDHSLSVMPVFELSILEVVSISKAHIDDVGGTTLYPKHTSSDDSDDLIQHHQDMGCCQISEMNSCLMGCYFIAFANNIELDYLKTVSPLSDPIDWNSYQLISENPPPRIVI